MRVVAIAASDTDHRAGFWRRYGLTAYWLLFALYAAAVARNLGYVGYRQAARYPWVGLTRTWIDLALEVALLSWILRPRTFHRSWGRLALALGVYAILGVSSAFTFTTDMPGYDYVPGQFHMVTFVGLFLFVLIEAIRSRCVETD